ncbi:TetR/AcrR family transcriptional regulator [Actinomycetes bacterium M1A6_2h]
MTAKNEEAVSTARDAAKPSTRVRLLEAGETLFGSRGFEESRLEDICSAAGVTTGAFYGYFDTKVQFFGEMFDSYVADLQVALDSSRTLEEAIQAYLLCARQHRGVVRSSFELMLADSEHKNQRRQLREQCASAIAWQLRGNLALSRAKLASRVLIDVLDQLTLSQSAGWTERRDVGEMARALTIMASKGLFRR